MNDACNAVSCPSICRHCIWLAAAAAAAACLFNAAVMRLLTRLITSSALNILVA